MRLSLWYTTVFQKRRPQNLSKELIKAARYYRDGDARAIYHQAFAGNCIELPSERCFTNGLGQKHDIQQALFDCSGLIVRSLCDVTGQSVEEYAELRHVRDIWRHASSEQTLLKDIVFKMGSITVGSLLVAGRTYTVRGQQVTIPGHIGIITDITGDLPHFIHASPSAGMVEERPLRTLATLLGYIEVGLH